MYKNFGGKEKGYTFAPANETIRHICRGVWYTPKRKK